MFFKPAYIKSAQQRRTLLKKVYHYRHHWLEQADLDELKKAMEAFKLAIKAKDKKALEKMMEASKLLLNRVGGHYYKNYSFFENIETLVVAAILAIGVRMYFLQPFKIPTNSMWPTYHGMTYTLYGEDEQVPAGLDAVAKTVFLGATQYEVKAPVSGELLLPVLNYDDRQYYQTAFPYKIVQRKLWGIFPTKKRQYFFYVDETPVTVEVPMEFSLEKVLLERFFGADEQNLPKVVKGRLVMGKVRVGDPILSFEIETGDMLFVDRVSYHFSPPQVGDPIVFRTRDIEGLRKYNGGRPDDKYYIKRLVGLSGDHLAVDGTTLMRNGQPITGSEIFDINAAANSGKEYRGYGAEGLLGDSEGFDIPAGNYFAMGDNSPESLDSRYWGAFPKHEMVGKAVFIYYPFGKRWGNSR